MDIKQIREQVHRRVLRVRSIERIINSKRFEFACKDIEFEEEISVKKYIDYGCRRELLDWIETKFEQTGTVEEMSMRDMRQLGQRMGIKGYNTLPKSLLLSEIKKHESTKIR